MADSTQTQARPFWFPDVKGFLALAIILIVAGLAFLLLQTTIKLDDKIAGAFMTVLGVLTACLKDVYQYFFSSPSDAPVVSPTAPVVPPALTPPAA